MKKKLLLICQHFYPEMISTGLHMTELATAINNNFSSIEIEVLCSYPSKNTFTDKEILSSYKNVNIIRKRSNGKEHGSVFSRLLFSGSFFFRVFIYLLFHQKKYAGFIITTNPPFLGIATVILKKIFGKRYFLIVYDVYPDLAVRMGILKERSLTTNLWGFITKTILKNADGISVIGRDMKRIIDSKTKKNLSKIFLIRNWSDDDHIKPVPKEENLFLKAFPELCDKFLFVYSGNMGRTHNMEDILAFAKKFESEKNYRFIFIGGGVKFSQVKEAAKTVNNVIVLPYQSFEMLPHVLNASTFCFVCLDRNFTGYSVPSKTYAVMAAGKPLIAFIAKDSEVGLSIIEAKCGFVVSDSFDLEELKKQVLYSVESGEVKEMGKLGWQYFNNNYTLGVAAAKYHEALEETFR